MKKFSRNEEYGIKINKPPKTIKCEGIEQPIIKLTTSSLNEISMISETNSKDHPTDFINVSRDERLMMIKNAVLGNKDWHKTIKSDSDDKSIFSVFTPKLGQIINTEFFLNKSYRKIPKELLHEFPAENKLNDKFLGTKKVANINSPLMIKKNTASRSKNVNPLSYILKPHVNNYLKNYISNYSSRAKNSNKKLAHSSLPGVISFKSKPPIKRNKINESSSILNKGRTSRNIAKPKLIGSKNKMKNIMLTYR